ncbi:NAD(P)-binding protein [Amniculicola lignicola CBS 123094]|uniref:NAD(P)-binding protein n=1 Tax=Amniculicola lignicola CBS 123094 TaxID=1392246 RepID=A0A6A5VW53_9PLEO|nr:NAD(P)-binding protein [Amniculicola lignicola CBS 123094]
MTAEPEPCLGTVVIIGGNGLLGHHIVQKLLEARIASHIVVFDILTSKRIQGVEYITGNLTSRHDIMNLLIDHRPKVIFHTASPSPLTNNKRLLHDVNVNGTRNLLDCISACSHPSLKALVYTSTTGVAHNGYTDTVHATENSPLCFHPNQKVYYAHTKAVAEDTVLKANRSYNNFLTAAIRPGSLYGEHDHLLTGSMIDLGRKNIIIGHGKNGFDFTYVGNCADAHILAAKSLVRAACGEPIAEDRRVDGEAFFVTDDQPLGFWEFSRVVTVAAGFEVDRSNAWYIPKTLIVVVATLLEWIFKLLTFGTRQPTLIRSAVIPTTVERTFDISKAREQLGYTPQVDAQEAIRRTAAWYNLEHPTDTKSKDT